MAKSLEFLLALDNTKFNRALDRSETRVKAAGRKIAAGLDPAVDKFKQLRTSAANFAAVGLAVGAGTAAVGLAKLNGFLQESIDLANEQEAAEAKLAAVVKATGGAAGLTAQQMAAYAGQLQEVTTYGDEATISGMAILATFKQIKGDEFKRATKAAQDMSTIVGQDLNSSILQIGKALNDPIKGLSSLSRVGVQFTDVQKEMITKLQQSGDLMGAQAIILAELESEYGGAAEKVRQAFGGMQDAVGNAFGDFKEQIGFAITKNQFFVEGLKTAEGQIKSYTAAIAENSGVAMETTKNGALDFLKLAEGMATGLDYIYRASQGIAGLFQGTAAAALYLSGGIFKVVQAGAALTDWLGMTDGEFERWTIEAEAAFGASDELQQKAGENFRQMSDGAPKIQAARDALKGFREEIEKVPAEGVGDIKKEADAAKDATVGMADKTEEYGDKLVKVNGVWKNQKVELGEVKDELDDIVAKVERIDGMKATVTVEEKRTQAKMHGGLIGALRMASGGTVHLRNMAAGGFFPGFGGGDRRHVIAEDGEYMLDKQRVRDAGLGVVRDFHQGRYGAVIAGLMHKIGQRMQEGGRVGLNLPPLPMTPQMLAAGGSVGAAGGSGTTGEVVTVRFDFGGGGSPEGKFTRKNLDEFVTLLERQRRLRS